MNADPKTTSIGRLPDHVKLIILQQLPTEDLIRVSQVCSYWRSFCRSVWPFNCRKLFTNKLQELLENKKYEGKFMVKALWDKGSLNAYAGNGFAKCLIRTDKSLMVNYIRAL
jgi:hypothetical protein